MKLGHPMIRSAVLLTTMCAIMAGCGREPAADATANSPAAATTAAPAAALAKLTVEAKGRRPAPEAFKAGVDTMMPLLTSKHEEISPIAVIGDNALSMHPGRNVSSWAEFDTTSLRSLDLYPVIRSNASCRANPEAGIVGLTLYSDGQRIGERMLLNNAERPLLRVDLNGAKTLKIEVDQGNGRISCDWFTVGFGAVAR